MRGYLVEYAWSLLATSRLTVRAWRRRPFDVDPGVQPTGHLLAARRGVPGPGRHAVRLRPARPVPRAVRVRASPTASPAVARVLRCAGTCNLSASRTASSQRTSPTAGRAERAAASQPPTSPSCAPDRTPMRCDAGPRSRAHAAAARHLAAYIGVMGPQDGVDYVVRAADHIVHVLGRTDIAFTLMGTATASTSSSRCRDELGLARPRRVHRPRPRRPVARAPLDGRRRPVARSEEPAQRRLHDEQDHGVHGVRAARRRVRPARDPRVGGGRGRLRASPTASTTTPGRLSTCSTTTTGVREMGRCGRGRVEEVLAWRHQATVRRRVRRTACGRRNPRRSSRVAASTRSLISCAASQGPTTGPTARCSSRHDGRSPRPPRSGRRRARTPPTPR